LEKVQKQTAYSPERQAPIGKQQTFAYIAAVQAETDKQALDYQYYPHRQVIIGIGIIVIGQENQAADGKEGHGQQGGELLPQRLGQPCMSCGGAYCGLA
jgi:hypothetical protein